MTCDHCARRVEEIERLREELLNLRQITLNVGYFAPTIFGLSPQEERVLGAIVKHNRPISFGAIHEASKPETTKYGYSGDETDIQIVHVIVSKLRRKLKPFGIEIITRKTFGYYMPPESREKIAKFGEWV